MADPKAPPHPAFRGFAASSAATAKDGNEEDAFSSLLLSSQWDCDGCPPPFFHLPPPPQPPSLYNEEDCLAEASISPYESCDNSVIVGDLNLHSEALNIVAVTSAAASLITVIFLVACLVYRCNANYKPIEYFKKLIVVKIHCLLSLSYYTENGPNLAQCPLPLLTLEVSENVSHSLDLQQPKLAHGS